MLPTTTNPSSTSNPRRPVYKATPSESDQFARCPYLLANGPKDERSLARERGAVLHTIIESFLTTYRRTGIVPDVETYVHRTFPASYMPDSLEAPAAFDQARESLHGVVQFLTGQAFRLETVELPMAIGPHPVMTYPGIQVFIPGRPDCLATRPDGSVLVTDWKTGLTLPPAGVLAARPSTSLYYLLAARQYPDAPSIEIANVLPHSGASVVVRPDEAAIGAAKDVARQVAIAKHTGVFPPRPGAHCAWCPLLAACPAHQHSLPVQKSLF